MIDSPDLTANPLSFIALFLFAGLGAAALAKIYGLLFMRWKTPYKLGDQMANVHARVAEWRGDTGYVRAGGELWRAKSSDALAPGDNVTISRMNGLLLEVRKKTS